MRILEQKDPPVVTSIEPGSAAEKAGVRVGDQVVEVGGTVPRDIIEWHYAVDEPNVAVVLRRGTETINTTISRSGAEPVGSSLYLKDDDYRLSFLYGNFTTLTRFTEADLERVITERISPLNVSIHSLVPQLRASMLRNERGAVSLRWLRELLKAGIEVRGQIVLCPGVNDQASLDRTFSMVLDQYTELASIAVVPLGLSKHNPEPHLKVHTSEQAKVLVDQVEHWRAVFAQAIGRPMVYAADEFYLLAGREWPGSEHYGDFDMYEDGIGMMRQLENEYNGLAPSRESPETNFFQDADTAHRYGAGYDANPASETGLRRAGRGPGLPDEPLGGERVILTGVYGAAVLHRVIGEFPDGVRVVPVRNEFFGGNTAVTGLMTGSDINRELANVHDRAQVFVPDVCLSNGRFLDGMTPEDLIRDILVVPTDGRALRRIVEG